MKRKISEYAKAVVAGVIVGGGTLLIYLGVDPVLVGILGTILAPLGVALKSNSAPATTFEPSDAGVPLDRLG